MMKSTDMIAIIFAILLVSVSAVQALGGSPVDAPEDPLGDGSQEEIVGAGVDGSDSERLDEPLPEQNDSGDDPADLGEDTPVQDDLPGYEADDARFPGLHESEEGDGTESQGTDFQDAGNDMDEPQSGETPQLDEENATVDPGSDNMTYDTVTTPVPTDPLEHSQSAGPETDLEREESDSGPSDSPSVNKTIDEATRHAAILCMWEQLDLAEGRFDDDAVLAGSQFLPPCAYGAVKTIQIHAVVTGDTTTPYSVVADVTSPDGSAFSRINLIRQDSGGDVLEAIPMTSLITYAPGKSLNEAVSALEDSHAVVYAGNVDLSFDQAPGDYNVSVQILPEEGDTIEQNLFNVFTYLPTASFEIDFAEVDYGTIELKDETWVEGDAEFGTAQKPTVRNTGNVPVCITITQNSMGLHGSVSYMAKIGNNETVVTFEPGEEVILPDVLSVTETAPLSLAITISQGEGQPKGRLQVSCVPAPPDI
ncbi:hypothetical protein [uncultured Methanofollis sp.]|uniref:hypothetical protein n=1 Tax=uncultured Methanofollis sp. TaxID=262500 RepID=UPI002601DBC1|nr:hypothetical protein [uncultured Methanofollis sp.]